MSEESVSTSTTQVPTQSPKRFNKLEELGFILSNYIKAKHPLQDDVNFMTIHDDITNEDFDIKRKDPKIFVSKHKNQRRPSKKSEPTKPK